MDLYSIIHYRVCLKSAELKMDPGPVSTIYELYFYLEITLYMKARAQTFRFNSCVLNFVVPDQFILVHSSIGIFITKHQSFVSSSKVRTVVDLHSVSSYCHQWFIRLADGCLTRPG